MGEIDRRERIDALYEQRGDQLVARDGHWDAPRWDPTGDGEHSVEGQIRSLQQYADSGGSILGAFVDDHLVGVGVVVPHIRPGTAQLAFLHVSAPFRGMGIGSRLCEELDQIARAANAVEMVVSATPSKNTVRFYLGRGFTPMVEPLPELLKIEPDDVHLHRPL